MKDNMKDEIRMRQIAEQVFREQMSREKFNAFNLPNHVHNGIDSPKILVNNVSGVNTLSQSADGVLSPTALTSNILESPSSGPVPSLAIPVIAGTGLDGFGGGEAPPGTAILFTDSTNYTIWFRFNSTWHGVALNLS